MAAAAHLANRFSQSNRFHRAVCFNSLQLRDGGSAGTIILTNRLEAEEQEARKLPSAVRSVPRHLQGSTGASLPEM